jgi:DNA-binding XRE family transcriptional regulator
MPRSSDEITPELKVIAEALSDAREKAKLSHAAAAEKIGVSRVTVIGWEKGTRCPTLPMFCKIADAYGIARLSLLRKISEKFPK